MAEQTLTAQQRAQLFAMSTRQNMQMLPTETLQGFNTSAQFQLPKARLLSNILVNVTAKLTLKHATKTSVTVPRECVYRMINRWSLDLNNGFQPFVLTGEEIALYNMVHRNGNVSKDITEYTDELTSFTVSSSGTTTNLNFTIELPVTLNGRDPIGLIMLQNEQTQVTLNASVGSASDLFVGENLTGFTCTMENVKITPMVTTYSIPNNSNAVPDLSVLKLVNGRQESMPSSGQQVIKLSTGTIYRKLLFKIVDADGAGMDVSKVTAPIQLIFNQADINYSIDPKMLRILNERELGYALPTGVFLFDFSATGGIVDMGGTRDYIDTEKLSEFWLRFSTAEKGKCMVVSECLARLA